MGTVEALTPQQIAARFHETYERLAVHHVWQTQQGCRVPFDELPPGNRSLMIAVVTELLGDGAIKAGPADD